MPNNNLPVKTGEDFIGEFEVMDLSSLKDSMFVVAVSNGDRNKCKFLASTVHGPYTFFEMCEEVGMMFKEHQHHAKVTILSKDSTKAPKFLDENTIDYIEAKYVDIVTEGMLDGVFDETKEYTCKVGINEADTSDDPRQPKTEDAQDVSKQDTLP
jgi:hypothetical protein